MSNSVIQIENLSKKYIISHQQKSRQSSLRDSINYSMKTLKNRVFKRPVEDPTHEDFWALKNVSFDIKQGDRVGLIGRNGAGKSTMLKILSRITEPTQGIIKIKGRVASLLEVGTGFHAELTGRENIYLNGAILGMSRIEIQKKFDEIVAFSEVEKFLDTPVKYYSSGMYIRLAFAVAAHLEPEILIVDEVLAVGDAQFQKKCIGKMEDVGKEGRTVIFVSHNFSALKALCNRGVLFNKGRKVFEGGLLDTINEYTSDLDDDCKVFKPIITDRLNINNIALCDIAGKILDYIDTDTDIYINISYEVKEIRMVGFCLSVIRENENVFISINNNERGFNNKKELGKYTSICAIPGYLLNDGFYTLDLTIFEENFLHPIDYKHIYRISVEDSPTIRKDYFGGYKGVIRPKLAWTTKSIF